MIRKKIVSGFLVLAMLLCMVPSAYGYTDEHSLSYEGDAEVPVELTQEASKFSVSVPTVLPVNMNSEGVITVSTNNKIINNSYGPIEVFSVSLTPQNDWELDDFDNDFQNYRVGTQKFGFQINDADVETNGTCDAIFDVIDGGDETSFTYDAKIAPQNREISDESIATVVFIVGWHSGFESSSQLEKKYTFEYYSNLQDAMDGAEPDVDKEYAVAARYVDGSDNTNVVLMKNTTINETVTIDNDLVFNLGGYTLTSNSITAISGVSTFEIDGRVPGSSIVVNATTESVAAVEINDDCTILGGNYITNTVNRGTTKASIGAITVNDGGNLTIKDARAISNDSVSDAVSAICVNIGGYVEAINCTIEGSSIDGYNVAGIANYGEAELTKCQVKALSNYLGNEAGNDYGSFSRGVYSYGPITLNDCYVYGTHCGVASLNSPLYINGGTYEGYGHGGVYTTSGAGNTCFIYDADLIGMVYMPDGYEADEVTGNNYAGIYIGGTDTTVYMDNCYVYGGFQPIVLRDTREVLYVSNTKTNTDYFKYPVRISNSSKLYIGEGCNFTPNQTSRPAGASVTDENYRIDY